MSVGCRARHPAPEPASPEALESGVTVLRKFPDLMRMGGLGPHKLMQMAESTPHLIYTGLLIDFLSRRLIWSTSFISGDACQAVEQRRPILQRPLWAACRHGEKSTSRLLITVSVTARHFHGGLVFISGTFIAFRRG
jgi:hypothetical protein